MGKYAIYGETLAGIADAIREKTGGAALLSPIDMAAAIAGIQAGGGSGDSGDVPGGSGGGPAVTEKDVNFYDYDGTLLHSYTVAEAQALSELPAGPEHAGLVFQKWNWSLENVKALTRPMNIGALYTTDDGTTRIYIHLEEGRTSPMLGIGVNGTVTVDWGDGTEPDVLTGETVDYFYNTPGHEYAAAGNYIIELSGDGEIGLLGSGGTYLLRTSRPSDEFEYTYGADKAYQSSITKIECGNNVKSVGSGAFRYCHSLKTIVMPDTITSIESGAFEDCYSLTSIVIPSSVTSIGDHAFTGCNSLKTVIMPNVITSIGSYAFQNCSSLKTIVMPDTITSIESGAFYSCNSLRSIVIPSSVTSIGSSTFCYCRSLGMVVMSNDITSIESYTFQYCHSLASIVIPSSVTSIGSSTFNECRGFGYCDFSKHTAVPTLGSNAFKLIAQDCEIRVPAALYNEWIAATNWATYASQIVAV